MKDKARFLFLMVFVAMVSVQFPTNAEANEPRIKMLHDWQPGMVVSEFDVMQAGIERCFMILDIDMDVWSRINGT